MGKNAQMLERAINHNHYVLIIHGYHQYLNDEPVNGSHERGDIVWNSEPEPGKPLGWVCVKCGAPGTGRHFGEIS